MEEKQKKDRLPWKQFFKDSFFLIILGVISFITYFIIYFLKNDKVYLYLSLVIPCIIFLWIGITVVYRILKQKKQQ
ncbi:MAG: hypothetical protein NC087_09240 [Anaeroplasma bactoclasticum]|nr:hypothetical protein [Anaeroplasma bactoclasticum]